VITDGHENASTEWNAKQVRDAVLRAEQQRNWRFVFLGADAGAFDDAQGIGIRTAAQYARNGGSVVYAMSEVDQAMRRYRGKVREGAVMAELDIVTDLTAEPKKRRAIH
jgi:hypothetical protein